MRKLEKTFKEKLLSGLRRTTLTTCSKWAETYRVMGKPLAGRWSFERHAWLRDMHDSKADLNVGMKAAQMGYTETLLNWIFYSIDILNQSCLYVLPTDDNASDFSTSRFDPALEMSPHLSGLFSDVKNAKHKRAGSASLFIRGSRAKNKLVSIPVARVAIDELDQMVSEHIPLIFERMSGQIDKQCWMISTPTTPGDGIHFYFADSTRSQFFFKCPHCGKFINFIYPDSIILDGKNSHLICKECKKPLKHEEKQIFLKDGVWVDETSSDIKGYSINQLYSTTVTPYEIFQVYERSQSNPADEQELYNSKFGLPRIVEGAKIDLNDINACLSSHKSDCEVDRGKLVTLGVDVGKWLHCELDEWSLTGESDIMSSAVPRVIRAFKLSDFEELDNIIIKYSVNGCVIDANPERRKAIEFCNRFYGLAYACFYGRDQKGRDTIFGSDLPTVTVDRTSWLDLSLGRFKAKRILLPYDLCMEYKDHVMNSIKIYRKDSNGNPIATYINGRNPDHYAHARNYAEIAFNIAISSNKNMVIR